MGLSYLAFRSFLKLQTASSVDFQPFLKAGLYNIYSYIYIYIFIYIYIYLYSNNYYYLLLLLLLFLSLCVFCVYVNKSPFVRTEPDVCSEPVLSRTKQPFFSTDSHEVCEGLLPQIVVKRAMKQILCRTHARGHTQCTVYPCKAV